MYLDINSIAFRELLSDEKELCNCGGRGCLTQIASATGIVVIAKRMLSESAIDSRLRDMEDITAKMILDAAKDGDELAVDVVDYCMSYLGKCLADISYVVDPEVIVIGGGLANAGPYILDVIYSHYKKYPKLTKRLAKFTLAELGAEAGMYGAAYLAMKTER